MAAEMTKGVVIDISGNTVKLTKAIKDARQEFATLGTEAKDMEKAIESGLYATTDRLEILTRRAEAAEGAFNKLVATYELNGEQLDRLDPRMVNIASNIAKMSVEVEKAQAQMLQARYEYENNARSLKEISDAFAMVENSAKLVDDALRSGVFSRDDAIDVLKRQIEEGNRAIEEMTDRYKWLLDNGLEPTDSEMVKLASEIGKMQGKVATATEKLRSLTTSANEFKTAEEIIIETTEKFGDDVVKNFNKTDTEFQKVKNAMKSGVFTLEDAFEMLAKEIKEGTEDVEEMRKQYEALLKQGFKPSDPVMVSLASKMGELNIKMDEASDAYKELRKEAEGTTEELDEQDDKIDNVTVRLDAWTVALGNLISRGIRRAIQAMRQFATAVYETGTAFEYSMASLEALYGDALEAGQIQELSAYFRELGTQSAYSATEIADAATALALAGYSLEETEQAIEPILQLTQATGESFEDMANIVVDGLHEFGMGAEEASRFADVLAKTAISTNTDVQDMGEALKYAGAVAGSFGFQIEDLAVTLGAMATQGVKGSMAGTALRTTITRLATNVSKARDTFESIGGAFYDATGNARPFYDIVTDLRNGLKGLNDEERANILYTIGGQRAITGLSAILNMSEEEFEELKDAVYDANGVVKEISEQKLDNLYGDAQILKNNFEEFKMTLYDEVQPALRDVTKSLTELLQSKKFQKKVKEFGEDVKDVIEWGLDHFPDMIDAAKTLFAVFVSVQVSKGIKNIADYTLKFIDLGQAVTGGGKAALEFASSTGMLGLAVAGLGLVIGACVSSAEDAKRAFEIWDPEASKLKDTNDELAESIADTTQATKDAVTEIYREQRNTRLLIDELDKYVDSNGNVKKSYEDRVNYILGELSSATGVEYELIDGQIQHYHDLKQSIMEAADEQARQALMTTFVEQYTESLKQQAEAQTNYNDALLEQNDYWNKMVDTYSRADYASMFEQTAMSQEQFLKMTKEQQAEFLKNNEVFQTDISRGYEQSVTTAQDNLLTSQENYYTAIDNLNKASESSTMELYSMLAEQSSAVDKSLMDSSVTLQSYVDQYNFYHRKAVEQWGAGNTEMARSTEQMATEALATAKQLASDMSDSQNQYTIQVDQDGTISQAQIAVETLTATLDTALDTGGQETGKKYTGSIGTGIGIGTVPLLDTVGVTGDDIIATMDDIVSEKTGKEIGTDWTGGIEGGVTEGTSAVTTATSTMANDSDTEVRNVLNYKNGDNIGGDYIQGIINGIREKMGEAISAAEELATQVNSKLQKTTQVNSPSKFTQWIAEEQVNGLVDTYSEKAYEVAGAMARLGASANSALMSSVRNPMSADQIADSVSRAVSSSMSQLALGGDIQVNVTLEGDAKGMFRVIRTEANAFNRQKGYSPFRK